MPIITRSMSKQLKRTRDEIDNESNADKTEEEPRRKKRRLNNENQTEDKENNMNMNNTDNKSNKSKKTKKVRKQKKNNKSHKSHKTNKTEIDGLKSKHRLLLDSGYKCIVGVDEAGRGPLAGPVVISAAYVPIDIYIEGITDSKKINDENEREKLYEIITSTKEIKYSVSILDHDIIDEYNILEASMMGMRECVNKLHDELIKDGSNGVDYALADGNRDPCFIYPDGLKYEYIIKGDAKIYCIGAASIIAKVTRDRIMIEYHEKYPVYQFKQNKGYPTPSHKKLVWSEGPCDIHRKSFKPVKDWYKLNKPQIHKKMELLKKQRADERKKNKLKKNKKGKNDDNDGKKGKKGNKKGQTSIMNFFGTKKKVKVDKKDKKMVNEEQKELESDNE